MKKLLIIYASVFLVFLTLLIYVLFRPYTITVDTADGNDPLVESYTINSSDIALGLPVLDGFEFTGWTGSNGDEPEMYIVIGRGSVGNRIYTANWIPAN